MDSLFIRYSLCACCRCTIACLYYNEVYAWWQQSRHSLCRHVYKELGHNRREIPENNHEIDTYDDVFTTSGWFMGVAQTRTATYDLIYFYSPKYKKYLGVVTFTGGYNVALRGSGEKTWYDDLEVLRIDFLYNIRSFSAYVNRQQWQDPAYGTRDNPVPIFFKRALSGHETLGMDEHVTISPSVNKKFVELYLAHELPSKEFNRLYGADMERLGLKD
ncbi:hypothetical protein [Prevotella fusca]|uniref:hypothetical protein n=1 Tax=Prevotella fusca TaxID=589436 RepID=UPI0034E2FEB6